MGQLIGYGDTANQYRVWDHIKKDVVVARDVVFDESLPASQPAILTSELAVLDEIRVLPVPTLPPSSPTRSEDSATVTTMTTAAVEADANEPMEEEYIPAASGTDAGDIVEGPRKGKGQQTPRYDQID